MTGDFLVRKVLMTCVALLSMAAGPVLAQQAIPSGSAVDIPGSTASSSPGTTPGTTTPLPDTGAVSGGGMTGLRPMRGQPKQAIGMNHFTHKPPVPVRSNARRRSSPVTHTSAVSTERASAPHTGDGTGGSASTSSTVIH